MSEAKKLLKMEEDARKDEKVGDNIKFKAGTKHAGMLGVIADEQKNGKIAVRVGKTLMVDIEPSDVEPV